MPDHDIPNITVGELIAGGAFGDVFRGRHQVLDVDVAVKVFRPTLSGQMLDDALKEARLMARLDHPNLLRVFDAGRRADGLPYLVMELMDGACADLHGLPGDQALAMTRQLLAGMQALHDARVLHRDIKPANCLVRRRDQRLKLADLGIAVEEASRTAQLFNLAGTLPFMAPELFETPPRFSAATDIYALGVTMQCLVMEVEPYPRGSPAQLMEWILRGRPSNVVANRPDLPRELSTLIDQMSARPVGARPASASEALSRLGAIARPSTARSAEETLPVSIGPWVVGAELKSEGSFRHFAVSHMTTGAAARLKTLRPRKPLSQSSAIIIESARRASQLTHPGFVDVLDWGMYDGRAYVVTRPQGQTMQSVVESSGPLGELEAIEMTRALADALVYLHGVGLVYQVVIPSSAVLAADGRSAQLAWPIFCVPIGARADADAASSLRITVPRFAAPESLVRPSSEERATASPPPDEQMIGRYEVVRELGERPATPTILPTVDLYGLGEILFFLIAGRPAYSDTPYIASLVFEKMRGPAMLRDASPHVTAPTANLVAALTSPDPDARPASAIAVRDELDRLAARLRG